MPALNRVELIGRLGKDPETRFTSKGSKVSLFSVAVDSKWKSKEGEVKSETDWFNVEAWGALGEICQKYLKKGRLIFISGRLRTRRYEHEGDIRYSTRVIADQMQMLEKRLAEEEETLSPDETVEEE